MSGPPPDNTLNGGAIRSYVLRRSHFSAAQRDAHARLMPVFGIPFSRSLIDLHAAFGREAPTILEIGFGMGETTAEIAAANPDRNYIGVEVHTPGVGALLKLVENRALRNVRVIEHDVQEVLDHQIPDGSLTAVHIFFPDPWPKARHHKRRLIQQQFIYKLAAKLRSGGHLHLATDWPAYAEHMSATLAATDALNLPPAAASDAHPAPSLLRPERPVTKFERRGLTLGHLIVDLIATKPPKISSLQHSDTWQVDPALPGSRTFESS